MRIRHKANVRITDDAAGKDVLFGPDDSLAEVVIDNMQRQASGLFNIAAAGTEALSLGDVTAVKGLYIKCKDGDMDVDINALGAIQVRRAVAGTGTCRLLIEGNITSVSITNPDGVNGINGVWCVWGDPEA